MKKTHTLLLTFLGGLSIHPLRAQNWNRNDTTHYTYDRRRDSVVTHPNQREHHGHLGLPFLYIRRADNGPVLPPGYGQPPENEQSSTGRNSAPSSGPYNGPRRGRSVSPSTRSIHTEGHSSTSIRGGFGSFGSHSGAYS